MSKKILLDKINVPGIRTYEVYRREGGYASVEKALKKMTPDASHLMRFALLPSSTGIP